MYNLTVRQVHTVFVGSSQRLIHGTRPERLYRFGLEAEPADRLARQAAQAEENGFPHGVSAFSQSSRPDATSAERSEVEKYFPIHKTGRNPYHYTVELPKPVTQEVAKLFNKIFGRVPWQ